MTHLRDPLYYEHRKSYQTKRRRDFIRGLKIVAFVFVWVPIIAAAIWALLEVFCGN